MTHRYQGVNCSKCGKFVGTDGFMDAGYDSEGVPDIGYPLCGECLKKRGPTIYDLEVELRTLREQLPHVRGEGNPIRKRINEIQYEIERRGAILNTKPDCAKCIHASTPKGRPCYIMTRRLKELVTDAGNPFYPEFVIPALDTIANECKRYKLCTQQP